MAYVGKRKSIRQKLAWMLSAAIVVTSLSFGGATVRAEENGSVGDNKWDFKAATADDAIQIQGATGEYKGLQVDATTGKLNVRAGDWAQFNNGTIIKVPVGGPCEITVDNYDTNYKVNEEAATANNQTFTYNGEAGYVNIVATANSYIGSIEVVHKKVVQPEPVGDNKWDFKAATADDAIQIQGATGEYKGLQVDATTGKLNVRAGDWAQFNNGTIIKVPVGGPCEITVDNYDTNYKVNEEAATANNQTFTYNGEAGYVNIVATANSYIGSIEVVHKEVVQPEPVGDNKWDFKAATADDAIQIQGTTGEYKGLQVDATTGKLNVRAGDWAQFNNGTIIKVPVGGSCEITVDNYDTNYKVNGEAATANNQTFTYNGEAGYVEIVATANSYIGSIEVKHIVKPEPVGDNKWDFKAATADDAIQIQGATGEYKGLQVDATTGKLNVRAGDWAQFNNGTIIKVPVGGPCEITVDNYDTNYKVNEEAATAAKQTFTYSGEAGYVNIVATANSYIGSIEVKHIAAPIIPDKPTLDPTKADVWDFAAEAVDGANNLLTVDIINALYPAGTTAGSSGVNIGAFSVKDSNGTDAVKFVTSGTNHRIRTTNDKITRYDDKSLAGDDSKTYNGYLYSNAGSTDATRLEIYLYEADTLTCMLGSNGGEATYILRDPSGNQYATFAYTKKAGVETAVFHAAAEGWYQLYCSDEKLVCARITREHAPEVAVSGTVTVPAGIPAGYGLIFTNTSTGKETEAAVTNNAYSCTLYGGYTYKVSLKDANGFVIKTGDSLELAKAAATLNPVVEAVEQRTIIGTVEGLSTEALKKVELVFNVPENKVFVPELTLDRTTGAYTLVVESGVEYTVEAEGVNDFALTTTKMSASADKSQNIVFTKKPVYPVTLNITGVADSSKAVVTFTNINEEGYVYTFPVSDDMKLRNGSYTVKVSGLGNYAVSQGTTPNVNVNGAEASTTVPFEELSSWDFAKLNPVVNVETIDEVSYYAGLKVDAGVGKNKDYLLAGSGKTIAVPNVKKGDKVTIKYCYSAAFKVGDVKVDEKSGSTGQIDSVDVVAKEDGDLVIENFTGTNGAKETYFCAIEVLKASDVVAYSDILYVGADKEYKNINDALTTVRKMARTADQKVTIMIDPGNYEEMLVIDVPNITLKNASATPSIALKNKGVDIDDNAVRVTWYYGHGYTYYSMGSDCKYDAELLAANKSNGYASFKNPGSGTTNGSYWNASVVITADDFSAEGIIFENSFNQYVSAKSLEDVIEAQGSNAKEGSVPRAGMKNVGDTKVQEKEYVERAAALAIYNNVKRVYFNNCKFVSRQDTLYGGVGVTAGFENCSIYGGTDYIFGGMTAVFKQCDLVFNTNDQTSKGEKDDVGYITAPQQQSGRGYLMYGCTVTSTIPGVDTASLRTSKPGYLGRPWQANTGEAVFYMTTIDAADEFWNTGSYKLGESLIRPDGWNKSLGGESALSVEYGTVEKSGVDNSANRVSWAKVLDTPALADGSPIAISTFLGTWNPFRTSEVIVIPDEESAAVGMLGVTVAEGVVFTNEAGEEVTGEIDIKAAPTTATAAIIAALTQDKAAEKYETALVMYLDISAYLEAQGTETPVQLTGGKVWIKFNYPEGMSQKNEIVVFHNATKLAAGDVKQDATSYQFAADGFSPYTIVFKEIPGEPTPDDPTPVDPQPVNPGNSDDNDNDGTAEVVVDVDWDAVADRVDAAAKAGKAQNLDVTSGDRYEVPVKVLNKLKGKNTTLALHAGGGITLSITGTDIKKNAAAPFKAAMSHGNVIPAGAANQVLAGAAAVRMFSMEDKSVYPFPVNVHVNLGASNAGKTAYMYYYDEKSNSMVLAGSFRITATGQAMFALYRGDEYIIAVSDKPAAVKGKYIVVKGDNLTYIAKKTGVTLKKLIGANPQIKNVNRIVPGQEINLP